MGAVLVVADLAADDEVGLLALGALSSAPAIAAIEKSAMNAIIPTIHHFEFFAVSTPSSCSASVNLFSTTSVTPRFRPVVWLAPPMSRQYERAVRDPRPELEGTLVLGGHSCTGRVIPPGRALALLARS